MKEVTILLFVLLTSTTIECNNQSTDDLKQSNELIQLISHEDYDQAIKKFNTIIDNKQIWFIVKELYQQPQGFDSLINFSKKIDNFSRRIAIYDALHNEMEACGNTDLLQYVKLIEAIKDLNRDKDVQSHLMAINKSIERILQRRLKSDLLSGKKTIDLTTELVLSKLYDYDANFLSDIIENVIKQQYYHVNVKEMLSYFNSHPSPALNGLFLIELEREISDKNALNENAFDIGFKLKEVLDDPNFNKEVSEHLKMGLIRLLKNLPECVRNALFASRVCIKSNKFNEYLYAADNVLNYDNKRRRILTWIPGGKSDNGQEFWLLEPSDGNFYIKNVGYNDYLYAARGYNLDNKRRRVFAWIPGDREEKGQEYWQLEPKGDVCFIKSVKFEEYLYPIMGLNYDKNRREVATWIPKDCDDQCLWKIEDCST